MTNPRRMTPVTDRYTQAIFISAESDRNKTKKNKTELVKHLHYLDGTLYSTSL